MVFPPNLLFELDSSVYLSPPHSYSPFDTPNVPPSPSPRLTQVPNQDLFPIMETKSDNPHVGSTPQGIPVETSRTHIPSTELDPLSLLPPEGFPYVSTPYMTMGPSTPPPYSSMPLVLSGYNSLSDAFSYDFGTSSLFQNPIYSSGVAPTTSSFVPNMSVTTQTPSQPTMLISETHVPLNLSTPPIVATVTAVPNVSEQHTNPSAPMSRGKYSPPYTSVFLVEATHTL